MIPGLSWCPQIRGKFTDEARIHELERMIGRLALENDFLKKLLQKLENDS